MATSNPPHSINNTASPVTRGGRVGTTSTAPGNHPHSQTRHPLQPLQNLPVQNRPRVLPSGNKGRIGEEGAGYQISAQLTTPTLSKEGSKPATIQVPSLFKKKAGPAFSLANRTSMATQTGDNTNTGNVAGAKRTPGVEYLVNQSLPSGAESIPATNTIHGKDLFNKTLSQTKDYISDLSHRLAGKVLGRHRRRVTPPRRLASDELGGQPTSGGPPQNPDNQIIDDPNCSLHTQGQHPRPPTGTAITPRIAASELSAPRQATASSSAGETHSDLLTDNVETTPFSTFQASRTTTSTPRDDSHAQPGPHHNGKSSDEVGNPPLIYFSINYKKAILLVDLRVTAAIH